jgi:hypothetical protein
MALSDLLLLAAIVLVLAILGTGGYVLTFRKRFSFLKRPYPETGVRLSKQLGIPTEAPADTAKETLEKYLGAANRIPEFATGVMEIARDLTPVDHSPSTTQALVVPGINPVDTAKKTIVIAGKHPELIGKRKDRIERLREGSVNSNLRFETSLLANSTPASEKTGLEIAAEFPVGGYEPSTVPPIPWSYGECKITALVRDPYWLFAYWEINAAKREEIARRYGDQAWDESWPVLRVYDVTNLYFFDSRHYTEISSNDYASDWYIRTGQPNRAFCIELGRVRPDGSYIFLARSNFVSTPRDQISEVIDEEWLLLPEYATRLYGRIGGIYPGPSSPGSVGPGEPGGAISSPLKW